MKKILNLSIILGMLLICLLIPMNVQASSILEEVSGLEYAESTEYVLQRASHLSHGNTSITELSSNSISVYGLTQCHHRCDNVYLSIYLERKVNGNYSTYKYWVYDTTNATSLSKSLVVSVPTGYYYRVRAYHAAKCDDSAKESISSLTDGVYVG